jgi:hypothetical protein
MAKKAKEMVWHKKGGRMVSPKFLNPRGGQVPAPDPAVPQTTDRVKLFLANFEQQIKKASQRKGRA